MAKKVDDELADPYQRIISKTIPALGAQKGAEDTEWSFVPENGWLPSTSVTLACYYEDSIDLSGYANQQLTYFPELGFIQESPIRSLTGADASGITSAVIVTSVPLDIDSVITQIALASAPGLPEVTANETPIDYSMVPYCRIRLDLVDQNLISATGFTKPIEITQVGSLQPTAADKLFLYAIAIPNPTVTGSTSYTTMSVPACRVGFFGTMAEEPTIEYMMRLKRSYELANQV